MWFPGFYRVVGWRLNRATRRNNLAKAERIAASYAKRRPRDPHAWLMWALVAYKAGGVPPPTPNEALVRTLEHVERILRQGLELHPDSIELAAKLAGSLSGQGRYQEAELEWTALQARHPEFPVAYVGRARLAATWGNYEESKELAEEAMKRSPDPGTQEDLATSLLYVPGERRRAIELLERAVKVTKNPATHVLLALLVEDEDPARAQEHLGKAARGLPQGSDRLDREIARTRAVLANYPLPGS